VSELEGTEGCAAELEEKMIRESVKNQNELDEKMQCSDDVDLQTAPVHGV